MARIFSTKKEERTYGAAHLKYSSNEAPGLRTEEMEKALLLSMILAYSQGFELISKAAEEENWNIDLAGLAAVWKDGCIIRSALLGRIEQAEELSGKPLILSAAFSDIGTLGKWRRRPFCRACRSPASRPRSSIMIITGPIRCLLILYRRFAITLEPILICAATGKGISILSGSSY